MTAPETIAAAPTVAQALRGTLAVLAQILDCEELDGTDTLLLIAIADHLNGKNDPHPGVELLAARARCSYGTARRRLTSLDERGFIERTRRRRGDGNLSTYDYVIVVERLARDMRDGLPRAETRDGQRASGRAVISAHQGARAEPPSDEPPRANQHTASSSIESVDDPPPDLFAAGTVAPTPSERSTTMDEVTGEQPAFAQWWLTYPKKADKGAARKAWPRALRAVGGDARVLVVAAERYRDDPNREEGFTKYPATWLNSESWRNGPLPSRQGRAQVSSALSGLAAMAAGGSSRELDQ